MPTRFRKTITIFPGVKANISKGGVSFSLGKQGFTINVGKHGVRRTIGLPGTGVSNTEFIGKKDKDDDDNDKEKDKDNGIMDDAGALLMGMAAADMLDGDDDEAKEKPKRKTKKKEKNGRKRTVRTAKIESEPEVAADGYALRGLMVFAAIAIAVYLGAQVLPRLPDTWLSDLVDLILQWAVTFGHE